MAHDDGAFAQSLSSSVTACGQMPYIYLHSQHNTPAQEYSGSNFSTAHFAMESSKFGTEIQQRSMTPQLQPLVMPQWPSMLSSQSHSTFQPVYPSPVQLVQPVTQGALPTPVSATSTGPTPTPRKILTDVDRKQMCHYAKAHPNSKQTEIGAIFGVERSTVSKVLSNKEKYLRQGDGSRSSIKRVKGRSPDIERALAVWAKTREKKCLPLTDDLIHEKARAFSATTTSCETQAVFTTTWIETFKQKNNLMGVQSPKSAVATDVSDRVLTVGTSSDTPSGISPVSSRDIPSPELHSARSPEDDLDIPGHLAYQSRSGTSIHSASTDIYGSSMVEPHDLPTDRNGTVRSSESRQQLYTIAPADTMYPSRLPAHALAAEMKHEVTPTTLTSALPNATSVQEARQAFKVVMSFIEQQGTGYLSFQESIHFGTIMKKLERSSGSGS